ncbi:MAG TPA: sugar nucleotide-binding protein [Desulfuromonadaceae bacterium]|nr:sugar nucleotide-binding protein [Desulfuromonadaceae bacterium]
MTSAPTDNIAKRIAWVTGANGLIGNYLLQTASQFAPQWRVRAVTRDQFDLTDFDSVRREFQKDKPAAIIHCAAISTIAETQKNPGLARKVNVDATMLLAGLAADAAFVLFSTDLVFDGKRGNYLETDAINPTTLYSETKAAAEQAVLRNSQHVVVRTSINCGVSKSGTRGFDEQLRSMLQKNEKMALFVDEFRCPIFAGETARAAWELAGKKCAGIYHVAGAKRLSRWETGQLLVQRWPELKSRIEPGSIKDFSGPPRVPDVSLDISKVQRVLSKPIVGLDEWMAANAG